MMSTDCAAILPRYSAISMSSNSSSFVPDHGNSVNSKILKKNNYAGLNQMKNATNGKHMIN